VAHAKMIRSVIAAIKNSYKPLCKCKRTFFPVCRMSGYVNTLVYFYLGLVCLFRQKKYTLVYFCRGISTLVYFIQKERIHCYTRVGQPLMPKKTSYFLYQLYQYLVITHGIKTQVRPKKYMLVSCHPNFPIFPHKNATDTF